MKMKTQPAIYFPTTVLLIDDDYDFLTSLTLHLSPEKAIFKKWTDPQQCLIHLNSEFRPDPFEMNWVSRRGDEDFEHRIMDVNISELYKEVYRRDRFQTVSTIVVDYQMPGMNGLEFCESIKSPHIRKILLTGVTDRQIGIDALHKGLIHRYYRKDEPNLPEVLDQAVGELQLDYFRSLTQDINRIVMLPPEDTALSDSAFVEFLEAQARSFGAVERYLCGATGSFLFVNAHGETNGVYVNLEPVVESFLELADDEVPAQVLEKLKSRRYMLCYHSRDDHKPPYASMWERYTFPVTKVEGKRAFYCAVGPNLFDIDRTKITPFLPPPLKSLKPRVSLDRLELPLTSRQSELHSLNC
jgi:CheY-like chemotaxis protein